MTKFRLSTPVVFIIFRRPTLTQQVFDRIADARPAKLLVIADGPRTDEEAEVCAQTRSIIEQVDWDCTVETNFAERNLGLRQRIESGLNWAFARVDQAVILEDDCVPHPTFFRFCEELLDKYNDNDQVMHISGDNFGFQRQTGIQDSYYFSSYAHVWGWATWKRAWLRHDVEMQDWHYDEVRERIMNGFSTNAEQRYWRHTFARVIANEIQTWDYRWLFTCLLNQARCIMPYENQISNIGMGIMGTNTKNASHSLANLPTQAVSFPLRHPVNLQINREANSLAAQLFFSRENAFKRMLDAIKRRVRESSIQP